MYVVVIMYCKLCSNIIHLTTLCDDLYIAVVALSYMSLIENDTVILILGIKIMFVQH